MAADGDWAHNRSLGLQQVILLEVILLKIQLDRSRRQRAAHKTRYWLREVQRAAFYCRYRGIERAWIETKCQIFRVVAGESAVGDRSNDFNYRQDGQIGIKGRRKEKQIG